MRDDRLISLNAAIDELEERLRANGCSNVALVSELNKCIGYIMRLPSAQQWIPCSERLPYAECGESDTVLTTCGYRDVEDTSVRWIRLLYFNGGNWCYQTWKKHEQEGKQASYFHLEDGKYVEKPCDHVTIYDGVKQRSYILLMPGHEIFECLPWHAYERR